MKADHRRLSREAEFDRKHSVAAILWGALGSFLLAAAGLVGIFTVVGCAAYLAAVSAAWVSSAQTVAVAICVVGGFAAAAGCGSVIGYLITETSAFERLGEWWMDCIRPTP